MFQPRRIESQSDWLDADGVKIYTISARSTEVIQAVYLDRLKEVKSQRPIDWAKTPAFALFHDGATGRYLVLCWWGNDNELFTSVSVETVEGWIEDPSRYSFCLWDMEVMWFERNQFVECLYGENSSLEKYRASRFLPKRAN
jgi:hypothetical protein